MVLIILIGLVLMTLFMSVARLVIYNKARVYRLTFWIFTAVWTVVAIVSTFVASPAQSTTDALPVFTAVLLIPVASAYVVRRRMLTAVGADGR